MGQWIKASQKSSVAEGAGICVELENKKIALFQINGKFYAIDDMCRHRGGPLSEGSLDGNVITCPWHGFAFDITNGNCVTNSALKQTSYPVQVKGDEILIEIPLQTQ